MVYLTVTWRSVDLFVVPNWFICTDAANDDTSVVLAMFWIPSRNFSSIPACVRNVHHISQLSDWLVSVSLDIPLPVSMTLLEAVVWCVITPLSEVGWWIWRLLWWIYLIGGSPLRVNMQWCFRFPLCVGSIGITHFWWGSIPDIEQPCHGVPLQLSWMSLCVSPLGHLNYP